MGRKRYELPANTGLMGIDEAAALVGTSAESYRRKYTKMEGHPQPRFSFPLRYVRADLMAWINGRISVKSGKSQ